jgi:hypothetical protein
MGDIVMLAVLLACFGIVGLFAVWCQRLTERL